MIRDISTLECVAALFAVLGACEVEHIELATRRYEIADTGSARAGSSGSDNPYQEAGTSGSYSEFPDDSQEAFCHGSSNRLPTPAASNGGPGEKSVCMGQWASQTFRYALCSCKDAAFTGTLTTSAFNSKLGPCSQSTQSTSTSGGSVGTNGTLSFTGLLSVGGSATVAGDKGLNMSTGATATVGGDLRVRGPLNITGGVSVNRNTWLGDSLLGSGYLTVNGDLIQAPDAERSAFLLITTTGHDAPEQVDIRKPCACSDNTVLDIAGLINEARDNNHNALAHFDKASLDNVTGDVPLPCGRIFVSKIATSGNLTLQIERQSALFVEGDVISAGTFAIVMKQGASLDLFIGGTLSAWTLQTMGSQARPSKLRIYVAGDAPIRIPDLTTFAGNLYAPRALVEIGIGQTICGSIFAGSIASSGAVTTIAYDSSLLYEGESCNPPPVACNSCNDCGAEFACIKGQCDTCRSTEDCCEPLICSQGRCTEIVL